MKGIYEENFNRYVNVLDILVLTTSRINVTDKLRKKSITLLVRNLCHKRVNVLYLRKHQGRRLPLLNKHVQ